MGFVLFYNYTITPTNIAHRLQILGSMVYSSLEGSWKQLIYISLSPGPMFNPKPRIWNQTLIILSILFIFWFSQILPSGFSRTHIYRLTTLLSATGHQIARRPVSSLEAWAKIGIPSFAWDSEWISLPINQMVWGYIGVWTGIMNH